jgi:hypothetical protein
VLYLDWDGETRLLIEKDGIVDRQRLPKGAGMGTPVERDVIYVKHDAAVGIVGSSLSLEGLFLTGDFTRAGDFDSDMGGGTLSAATGGFCASALCCKGKSNRPFRP